MNRYEQCQRCGKEVATWPGKDELRPHNVPIEKRKDPRRSQRCQ